MTIEQANVFLKLIMAIFYIGNFGVLIILGPLISAAISFHLKII